MRLKGKMIKLRPQKLTTGTHLETAEVQRAEQTKSFKNSLHSDFKDMSCENEGGHRLAAVSETSLSPCLEAWPGCALDLLRT